MILHIRELDAEPRFLSLHKMQRKGLEIKEPKIIQRYSFFSKCHWTQADGVTYYSPANYCSHFCPASSSHPS